MPKSKSTFISKTWLGVAINDYKTGGLFLKKSYTSRLCSVKAAVTKGIDISHAPAEFLLSASHCLSDLIISKDSQNRK